MIISIWIRYASLFQSSVARIGWVIEQVVDRNTHTWTGVEEQFVEKGVLL